MFFRYCMAGICAVVLAGPAAAAEFKITFDWAGLKLCTSGSPNTVSNPLFKVSGLPKGTTYIKFKLTDLDVPGYPHGGGWVKISANGTVPGDVFRYKSPCPPSGAHSYEWTATAKTKKGAGGKVLGQAKARRKYPD
jgi:phosphatidylethanolamine-binding protein (PEBP) family uncharacterized protein